MVASTSLFSQLLSFISRKKFEQIVRKHGAEKHSKGFSCWTQLVSMMFCQLGSANSLREICGGLATSMGKLSHLGLEKSPNKSTLSYANKVRPWEVYEDLFYTLLDQARRIAETSQTKFRFKNPLLLLDSSTIDLCLSAFNWAHFRRTKGAIKLHLLLDQKGCLPNWALITDGKTSDVKVAQTLSFKPGTIVALDRGYIDYSLFQRWSDEDVYFVTRSKKNMKYRVVDDHPQSEDSNVLSDCTIQLSSSRGKVSHPRTLRLVTVWDVETCREIEILTNIFHLAPSTVGAIYKERWQIELFFKALKQNLRVKTFIGTTENAVKIQIWTALISILLLKMLKLKSTYNWSLSNLAALLRMNLLTYRDLWKWINDPFGVPILQPGMKQALLF